MKTNVRQGDLARIVRPYAVKELIDLHVTVVRAGTEGEMTTARGGMSHMNCGRGGVGWLCDANRQDFPRFIGDDYLRPIRDPGDDARDESLSWLPVPSREEVSA